MDNIAKANPLYSMRKIPKQARSKATISAILIAATRLLLDIGYDKSSTNKIAEIAGVSIGSLYEYFPSKEAIFAEIRRREDQRLFDRVMAQAQPENIRSLLKLHISTYLDFVRENLQLHAALINDVPQFAVGEGQLPLYRDYMPWAEGFLQLHKDELRSDFEIANLTEFVTRVSRATIENYVLLAPEQLNDSTVELMLIDLLESFLIR